MPDSFGARLRQRREERNVALSTIAEQTKIKLSLLEALERDDLSHWPSGIYRRAYIRAYGQAIGLSPDTVVREFVEAHGDSADVISTVRVLHSAEGGRTNGGPPTRLRNIVGAAIGSLARLRGNHAAGGPVVSDAAANPPLELALQAPQYQALELREGRATEPVAADTRLIEPAESVAPAHAVEPEETTAVPVDSPPGAPAPFVPDFNAVADLCTELGRVESADEVQTLLQEAIRILDATGLIVWVWDGVASELRPALVHGYSEKVVMQLPGVRQDDDNATAAAFRLARTCAIEGNDDSRGALVVPMLTPAGCAGVLALELQNGGENAPSVRAAATIVAAVLAQLIGGVSPAAVPPQAEMLVPPVDDGTAPGFRLTAR